MHFWWHYFYGAPLFLSLTCSLHSLDLLQTWFRANFIQSSNIFMCEVYDLSRMNRGLDWLKDLKVPCLYRIQSHCCCLPFFLEKFLKWNSLPLKNRWGSRCQSCTNYFFISNYALLVVSLTWRILLGNKKYCKKFSYLQSVMISTCSSFFIYWKSF